MSFSHLGNTRSARRQDHLLQTPDTFVRTPLPGMERATAIVHASPALGAAFTQYTAELESGGTLGGTHAQRFVYVIEGAVSVRETSLTSGGYCFIPEGNHVVIRASSPTRLAVIEKPYEPAQGVMEPDFLTGYESDVEAQPIGDDGSLVLRSLIPDSATHDFAVNTMTYQPGASLGMVEIHIMEHGLVMLEGNGIYRLGDSWYPVCAGDFIWMAPFCPQWFGALGKKPAKYLIYKDWNRHPL